MVHFTIRSLNLGILKKFTCCLLCKVNVISFTKEDNYIVGFINDLFKEIYFSFLLYYLKSCE